MEQELLFQKYRIIRLLGKGGTSKVYLAEHIKLNQFRAIKCISKNHPLYKLQLKESQILKTLKHSCIPTIYDIEEDEDCSYIVEQYLDGKTLKAYVETKGIRKEDIIIRFALQICDLIHYLHTKDRPILYLDLKPENIIVTGESLKLIDFGSAIYYDEITGNPQYCGTKGFAAPELYKKGRTDDRSDVYGIGMLLYYMVTGSLYHNGITDLDNIDFNYNCSKELKKIINRCLKFNPSQRFASVAQLSKHLSAISKNLRFHCNPGQSIRIAVAGAQSRIGTTHLAFRVCCYFIHNNVDCVYQEMNNSNCVWSMKDRYEGIFGKDGIYEMEGIPMVPFSKGEDPDLSGYPVILQDLGCLTEENLMNFLEAEVKILVLGAKDWELQYAEQVLDMVAEYKDILYLFNYLDGRQFVSVMKSMDRRLCYRIPYEPDPFAKFMEGSSLEFYKELSGFCFPKEREKCL